MAQELLLGVIVVFGIVLKLPREAAIRQARDLGGNAPAGEGSGRFAYVFLRVVALSHAEEFQELPPPVLIHRPLVVFLIVQPENHRRVLGQCHQQVAIVPHAILTEHLDLRKHLVIIVDLGVPGRKHVVPKENHLLFQGAFRVHQVEHPVDVPHWGLPTRQQRRWLVAQQHIVVCRLTRLGVQQLFHRRVIPLGRTHL